MTGAVGQMVVFPWMARVGTLFQGCSPTLVPRHRGQASSHQPSARAIHYLPFHPHLQVQKRPAPTPSLFAVSPAVSLTRYSRARLRW
jgi:hypothetical protein